MQPFDKDAFRDWLREYTTFSNRVVNDTICRLSRLDQILSINSEYDLERFLFELGRKAEFSCLSPSVKSQMKRAFKLYFLYKIE